MPDDRVTAVSMCTFRRSEGAEQEFGIILLRTPEVYSSIQVLDLLGKPVKNLWTYELRSGLGAFKI